MNELSSPLMTYLSVIGILPLILYLTVIGCIICVCVVAFRRCGEEQSMKNLIWWCWTLSATVLIIGIIFTTFNTIRAFNVSLAGSMSIPELLIANLGEGLIVFVVASAISLLGQLAAMVIKLVDRHA